MTTYELYIGGALCDLDSNEAVTLRFQSPIFSELDSIQSNRSYNISLPPTPRNMQAIGQAQRVDVNTNVPYTRLSAALYMNGVPLFTKGYAVVTDIADTINVTLTWGNVDNFQPLFDNNLRDLGQEMEDLGADHIDWNESSTILDANTQNKYPGVAFWGVSFGMGLGDPKYIHPSVQVSTILEAIEKQHGIAIDGKERLYNGFSSLGLIVPLIGKNGDEESGESENTKCELIPKDQNGYTILSFKATSQHPEYLENGLPNVSGCNKINITVSLYFQQEYVSELYNNLACYILDNTSYKKLAEIPVKKSAFETGGEMTVSIFGSVVLSKENGNLPDDKSSFLVTIATKEQAYYVPTFDGVVKDAYVLFNGAPRENVNFPSIFPSAPNLPDMSQGDFILALMNMNGLFAYADKDNPDMIRLISIDDIISKAEAGDVLDWSAKVILNDINRVDMPDGSEFSIDNLAQTNILDYDNDDEVDADTHGVIKVNNVNIEDETELVTLPFSASNPSGTSALVPIYKQESDGNVTYSECTDRILTGSVIVFGGSCRGEFPYNMKFGGKEGIVETRYSAYRRVVSKVRLITVRAKLSEVDLLNLDYTTPVYISQFGQLFAIYSVETGEDGVCDCQLLTLNYRKAYYIQLDGQDADYSEQVDFQFHKLVIPIRTNGMVSISEITETGINAEISDDLAYITINVQQNRSNSQRVLTITLQVDEDPAVTRKITITQLGQSIRP